MTNGVNWPAAAVFVVLFTFVTLVGFYAARWRRGNLDRLHEWGLGGRRFGTLVTWFLLGGDLYTAYTFIAVPALVFGKGAIGFFALPFTILAFPVVFVVMPRLWSVSKQHDYITAADFVRGRFDSGLLALAVALTGILATMPYIALQLVGIQVVIAAMGIQGHGWSADLPLIIAFAILAAYTYKSGIRAPAMIAIVKDTIIYIAVLAAVIVIPTQLGGYGHIFSAVPAHKLLLPHPKHGNLGLYSAYATLALGSALGLFLYPHAVTGVLSSNSRRVIRRNTAMLPAYSLLLGLIAVLGYMAIASGVSHNPAFSGLFKQYGPKSAVPALFLNSFPAWFAGFAFAAIAIGALVPASIMSIAASNLFTRNIYKQYLHKDCTEKQEAQTSKLASLMVKLGALGFIIFLPLKYAITLQLLGGVWILQTFPAVILGLYTRWFHRWALFGGWLAGMATGTGMAAIQHFKKKMIFPVHVGHFTILGYAALWAFIANIGVTVVLTALFRAFGVDRGADETSPRDYHIDPDPTPTDA